MLARKPLGQGGGADGRGAGARTESREDGHDLPVAVDVERAVFVFVQVWDDTEHVAHMGSGACRVVEGRWRRPQRGRDPPSPARLAAELVETIAAV